MPSERIDPPQYSAFRIADGGRMLTVIERREKRDSRGRCWSTWFSERAPNGERVEIDLSRPATGIDESIARAYIELIAQGQPLPADFVRNLFISLMMGRRVARRTRQFHHQPLRPLRQPTGCDDGSCGHRVHTLSLRSRARGDDAGILPERPGNRKGRHPSFRAPAPN